MPRILDTTMLIDYASGRLGAGAMLERLFAEPDDLLVCDAVVAEAFSIFLERLPNFFMVGDRLLRLAGSEFLSLSCRQTEISAFLVVDHFPSFSLNPAGFSFASSGRGAC